ncbi:hypothetical protein [uncultured Adlercreutzia sp.]|uniref:hypothetical protein n=1 Tax=uncultured Adlercreutzia sp. TaxID=875803 RepID=UPI0026771B2F|nr:hypothetical protein [uncultured Adlercreutzia sp.]
MKTSTLAIAIACAAALAVPAVAFAALAPSPVPAAALERAVSGGYHHTDHRSAAAGQADPSARAPRADGRAADRAECLDACPGYLDADGDGACDNCVGAGAECPGYLDADGNGVCDNCAAGGASCPNYRGADGICDRSGEGSCARGSGHAGRGHGCGR